MAVWRPHPKRCIPLVRRVHATVAVVILVRVRVRVYDRVFIEHLTVRMVFSKVLIVCHLILDLGLHHTEALGSFCCWQDT